MNEATTYDKAIDCLRLWQRAAWAGDAYKYCEASNERDRILDELLGEGTTPSKSDNNTTTKEISQNASN